MVEDWILFLKRMAKNDSKPYTGSSTPHRGYKKKMRLSFRKMLRKHKRHNLGI